MRIAIRDYPVRDRKGDLAVRVGLFQVSGDGAGQRAQVDRLSPHFLAGDARQIQQVVDQLTHPLSSLANTSQIVLALEAQLVAEVFEQRQAEAVDAPEGRAQVMRDGVAE